MRQFQVAFLPEAALFLETLDEKAREKIYYNIRKSQHVTDNELLKKLNENIWELRTLYGGKAYRLFSFWDEFEKALIIATHGIVKKQQKTPRKEIERAEKIRIEYLESKRKEYEKK